MILMLTPDDVSNYWELIKFGVIEVNRPLKVETYCNNLLKFLMSEKWQCWISVNDETKKVEGFALTEIRGDLEDVKIVFIDTIYSYSPTSFETKKAFVEHLKLFGENVRAQKIQGWSSNTLMSRAAEAVGFEKIREVYNFNIGGE